MDKITIEVPDDRTPDLTFIGEELAMVSSQRNNSVRWTEFWTYRTQSGKIVLVTIGETQVEDEKRFVTYAVFGDTDELTAKLGTSRLAMRLYKKLGIDTITVA